MLVVVQINNVVVVGQYYWYTTKLALRASVGIILRLRVHQGTSQKWTQMANWMLFQGDMVDFLFQGHFGVGESTLWPNSGRWLQKSGSQDDRNTGSSTF